MATIVSTRGYSSSNILTNLPTLADAFGRLRVSEPYTLFDSFHRFSDNGLWATNTGVGGAAVFSSDEGLVNLNVTAASGSFVQRETLKVFAYQPGKSLLILTTFVMSPAKTGLSQRVGYYGDDNGFYLELEDNTLSFVRRSSVTGSIVETPVDQANWNYDKMDGTGPSGITLDITKAQILWMDMEWLGVGSVRMGFVIDDVIYISHVLLLMGSTAAPTPPVAPRKDHTQVWHGQTFLDPYYWLREKGTPEVVKYLEAENAYTDATTADLQPFRQALYAEMLFEYRQ